MKGWREGGKKVSLLIVSERAQTLVVVGESGLACSGGMRQPRRGADAGNDSDDRFLFFSFLFLSFVFRHGVLACKRMRQRLFRFAAVYWLVTTSRRIN